MSTSFGAHRLNRVREVDLIRRQSPHGRRRRLHSAPIAQVVDVDFIRHQSPQSSTSPSFPNPPPGPRGKYRSGGWTGVSDGCGQLVRSRCTMALEMALIANWWNSTVLGLAVRWQLPVSLLPRLCINRYPCSLVTTLARRARPLQKEPARRQHSRFGGRRRKMWAGPPTSDHVRRLGAPHAPNAPTSTIRPRPRLRPTLPTLRPPQQHLDYDLNRHSHHDRRKCDRREGPLPRPLPLPRPSPAPPSRSRALARGAWVGGSGARGRRGLGSRAGEPWPARGRQGAARAFGGGAIHEQLVNEAQLVAHGPR